MKKDEKFTLNVKLPEEMKEKITSIDKLYNGFIVTTSLDRKFYIQYFEVEEIFPKGIIVEELIGKPISCLLGED